jgi:hypothetical protein
MRLNKLTLKNKKIFNKFLTAQEHELSVYAFEDIYIWKGLYDIRWTLTDGNLCVFFIDKMGCFLYLPPLGKAISQDSLEKTFAVMDGFNKNREISRIENIEEKDAPGYRDLGWECKIKSYDYLCERLDLVRLQGNKFKSKRACCNYFIKHYAFEYPPLSLKYKKDCLQLYDCWANQRRGKIHSHFYQGLLADSKICLKTALGHYSDLNFMGRIVKINKKVKAFTLGYPLSKETFCILYEITDIGVKGLAQFIFREFCRQLKDYRYINIMDDSGLENLKEVKLSYKPVRLIPSFTVTRKNA